MRAIVKQGQRFSRRVVSEDEARDELAKEPYKLELVGLKGGAADAEESVEVGGSELTMYDNLDARSGELCWRDLCRGPHLPTTRHIPAFKPCAAAARTGGARRTRSFSGSTAPHGETLGRRRRTTCTCWRRPSAATIASSAPSLTCSRSRRRWPGGVPPRRAAPSGGSWRSTRAAAAHRGRR